MKSTDKLSFKIIFTVILAICITISNLAYAPMQFTHAAAETTLTISGITKTESKAFVYMVDGNNAGTLKVDSLTIPDNFSGNKYTFESIENKTYTITITASDGYTFKNLRINNTIHPIEEFSISDKNTYSYSLSVTSSMENINLIPEFKKSSSQGSGRKITVGDTLCIDETSSNPVTHYSGAGFTIIPSAKDGGYILNINDGAAIGAITAEGSLDLIIKAPSSGTIESKNDLSITGAKSLKIVENTKNTTRELNLKGGIKISDEIVLNANVNIGTTSNPSHCGIKGGNSSSDNNLNLTVENSNLNIYRNGNAPLENIGGNISVGSNGKIQTYSEGKPFNEIQGKISVSNGGQITANFKEYQLPTQIYSKWTDWQDKIWSSSSTAPEQEAKVQWDDITPEEQQNNHYYCSYSDGDAGDYNWELRSTDSPIYTLIYGKGKNGETNESVNGIVSFLSGQGQCISENVSENYGEYKFPADSSVTVKLLPRYGFQLNNSAVQRINTTPQADTGTYTFTMPAEDIYLSELFSSSNDQLVINSGDILNVKIAPYSDLINGNFKFTISSVADPSNASSFENSAKDYQISNYFNLVLDEIILKNGDSNQTPWEVELSELANPVGITLELSEALKGKKRYCVLREHNGEITNLSSAYNPESNEIEFFSDKFSTYAIGYSNIVRSLSTEVEYNGEKLSIIIEDPNNALNDEAELVVTLVKEGSDRYNELKNNLDDTHKIENLIFFDIVIYKDSTHTEVYSQLEEKVNVLFQIPTGWDKEDLQTVLVAEGIDGEFDEELINKNDIEYLSFWTDHFSPYAFLDALSDEDLENLSGLVEQNESADDDTITNFLTGDSSRTLILIAITAGIISLAIFIILKKKSK